HDLRHDRGHPVLDPPARRASPRRDHRLRPGGAAPRPPRPGGKRRRRPRVSEAAVAEPGFGVDPAESPLTPESWGKLGMWVFLAGDAMSFGGLICGYAALRFGNPDWPVPSTYLGVPFTAMMTFLLICSSVTMVKALEAIKRGDRAGLQKFLGLTILGGICFLGMQAREWSHLIEHVMTLTSKGLFSATFFVLTGFHGCHV